jgi:hypothetical protein
MQSADAVTAASARTYGLQIEHAQRSSMKLDAHKQAVQLDLVLTNSGDRGLYDIRVFLIRPDTRRPVEQPARVRVLPAGESTALTWTFELPQPVVAAKLHDVTFRIEAIDQASQEIVSFNQHSKEAR